MSIAITSFSTSIAGNNNNSIHTSVPRDIPDTVLIRTHTRNIIPYHRYTQRLTPSILINTDSITHPINPSIKPHLTPTH